MSLIKKSILIVEDELSVRSVLSEALTRKGYVVSTASSASRAEAAINMNVIDLLLVDCVLPGESGVDFICQLRPVIKDVPVYLMSGILKDKQFVEEACRQTKAKGFFYKPLNIEKLCKELSKCFEEQSNDMPGSGDKNKQMSEVPFQDLLENSIDGRIDLKKLEDREKIFSYELPFIIFGLIELGWKGEVVLDDDFCVMGLEKEGLVSIWGARAEGCYKRLLLKNSYISLKELDKVPFGKDIVKRLVERMLISPHFQELIEKDFLLAYFKEISSFGRPFRIKLRKTKKLRYSTVASLAELRRVFNSFIDELTSVESLEKLYKPVMDKKIIFVGAVSLDLVRFFRSSRTFKDVEAEGLAKQFDGIKISSLASSFSKDVLFKLIHLFMAYKAICFLDKKDLEREEEFRKRIHNLKEGVAGKGAFEVMAFLGASRNSRKKELGSIFNEFIKNHHPDTLPRNLPKELKDIAQQVFMLVSSAYSILSNEKKRKEYLDTEKEEEGRRQLESERLLEEGKRLIDQRKYEESFEMLQRANSLYPTEITRLYLLWIELKCNVKSVKKSEKEAWLARLSFEIVNMSMEMKAKAIYHLVLGVYLKVNGDIVGSFESLSKALSINPNFLEAKRELFALQKLGK